MDLQDPALGWREELAGNGFQPCAMAMGEQFVPFENLLWPNMAIRLLYSLSCMLPEMDLVCGVVALSLEKF